MNQRWRATERFMASLWVPITNDPRDDYEREDD